MIKGLEHLSCGQAERTTLVQQEEENASGTPHCTLSVLEVVYQIEGLFTWTMIGQGGIFLN